MSNLKIKKLIDERSLLLEELGGLSDILYGSWVERYSVCSIKDCKCHRGERHGPRYYLVINKNGCQRQKYIPLSMSKSAQKGVEQYKKVMNIIGRITSINLELIKERKYG